MFRSAFARARPPKRLSAAKAARVLTAAAGLLLAVSSSPTRVIGAAMPSDTAAIVHAVDRLTFGATPDTVARARRMGLGAWIDEQLEPSRLEDGALAERLARFGTLALSSATIAREYFLPARRERVARQRMAGTQETSAGSRGEAQRKDQQVLLDLAQAKILRAVYSERQLEELLVDFWFNHFNVFAGKGRTRIHLTEYEREAIRPHVLGRFRDLLGATAESPAMLFYLDNWMSSAAEGARTLAPQRVGRPQAMFARRRLGTAGAQAGTGAPGRARGLNENYARELLELHTLGVDGGYTQQDIVEIARAFTGWTIGRPEEGGFRFVPAMHDAGAKTVLGQTIAAGGGKEDGDRVLDILAAHPATARAIAGKLARRFISDQPPPAVVERAAARFRTSHGDLRQVVRVIVTSPEFFAPESRAAKVKTPLEFVASALRASGATVDNALPAVRALRDLGMPLYLCQPPTGYDDTADTWMSSGALVNRMQFALDLASGRLRGIASPALDADLDQLQADLASTVLHDRASPATLATIARATTPEQTMALAIGSPEFQRR